MGLYRKILFSDPLFRHNVTPEDSLWVYRKKWRCHRIPSAHKAECNTVAAPFFIICYSYPTTKGSLILQ